MGGVADDLEGQGKSFARRGFGEKLEEELVVALELTEVQCDGCYGGEVADGLPGEAVGFARGKSSAVCTLAEEDVEKSFLGSGRDVAVRLDKLSPCPRQVNKRRCRQEVGSSC